MKKKISVILSVLIILLSLPFALHTETRAAGWVSAWSGSMTEIDTLNSQSAVIKQILNAIAKGTKTVRISLTPGASGNQVKLSFSNRYGKADITLNSVTLANTAQDVKAIDTGSLRTVTFGGSEAVTIPRGGSVTSDSISMGISQGKDITVSFSTNSPIVDIRTSTTSGARSFLSFDDRTKTDGLATLNTPVYSGYMQPAPLLCAVDVVSDSSVLVITGDSTVNNQVGAKLAYTLRNNGKRNISVVNKTIIGNRLLTQGSGSTVERLRGDALLNRFDSDVLSVPGIKQVVVKIGAADIAAGSTPADVINGLRQLISKAHAKGVKIYIATISPWKGHYGSVFESSLKWSQLGEDYTTEVNRWIKSSNGSDGYIDLDAMRDASDSARINTAFSTNGATTLTDAGENFISDAIAQKLFGITPPPAETTTRPPSGGSSGGGSTTTTKPPSSGGGSSARPPSGGSGGAISSPGSGSIYPDYNDGGGFVDDFNAMDSEDGFLVPTTGSQQTAGSGFASGNFMRNGAIILGVVGSIMIACVILLVILDKKKELVS